MGSTSSKRVIVENRETVWIRNGVPPPHLKNGIEADGRSIYSDKPHLRTYNIPIKKHRLNYKIKTLDII